MSKPVTWILVTVKGRPDLTERCVASVLDLTSGERRVIAVDNGSRDSALDWLYERFRRGDIHRLICNKVDTLPQWEKSYAIHQAVHALRPERYDYLAWIDNDMEVRAGWLDAAQRVLVARPDLQVCSVHNDDHQEKRHPTMARVEIAGVPVLLKETANGALWVVRRDFFDLHGLPPVGQGIRGTAAEDWHYSHYFRDRGVPFAVIEGYSVHLGWDRRAPRAAMRGSK